MALPNTYTTKDQTGCCSVPDIKGWDNKKIEFKDKLFIRQYTKSLMYVPLNMGKVMTSLNKLATDHKAELPITQGMILSYDQSPWKAEQLYAVSKPIKGADNVKLSGTFLTKVFEGPYKDAGKWHQAMKDYATSRKCDIEKTYFFYTTCPKCAKVYGKNYTIALAKIK